MNKDILEQTVKEIAATGKGILAADESTETIKKRFDAIKIESTEENRITYREMLFSTPNINEFISGVILFEETLYQSNSNKKPFPEMLSELNILPGIKVDKGFIPFTNFDGDKITEGLDSLGKRLAEYKKLGVKFAKWRAVLPISQSNPSCMAIKANAYCLARYASICQEFDIVPIVEPELLMDGEHTIERCEEASRKTFLEVFNSLHHHRVFLEGIILKPGMILPGSSCSKKASTTEIAEKTLKVLRETVPATVQTINFLSGGQTSEESTERLNAMNASKQLRPWNLSFSYGRALQDHALKAWSGKKENFTLGQQAFYKRAKLNSLAATAKYSKEMEKA